MSADRSIILGGAFALVGGFFGGATGAQVGWMIGSTIGSIMGLKDEHTTNYGPRITDFKVLNSKYGITIPRGFGCIRMASNLIWVGAVTEETEEETQCVDVGAKFLFLDLTREVCQTEVTYHYFQSGAFGLCEGEIAAVTKLWGDGALIYSQVPTNEGEVTELQTLSSFFPDTYSEAAAVTVYTGSATQGVDPIIAADIGADAPSFRNLAYVMLNEVLLDDFGYRLPTINAEVCYEQVAVAPTETPLATTSIGGGGFDTIGLVQGRPDLLIGLSNAGDTTRIIYNLVTQDAVLDTTGGFTGGSPTFIGASSTLDVIRGETISGGYQAGIYNYQSGVQKYWDQWTAGPSLTAIGSGVAYTTFDVGSNTFLATFQGGGLVLFRNQTPQQSPLQGYSSVPINVAESNPIYPSEATGVGREVFTDTADTRWWLTDGGAAAVYINRLGTDNQVTSWQVRFTDSSTVSSASNWTYVRSLDAFFIQVDVAGTSPVGLYRLNRSYILAGSTTVDLPSSVTAGEYLSTALSEDVAFQAGAAGTILTAQNSAGDAEQIELASLTLIQTITTIADLNSQTFYAANMQTIVGGGQDLIAFRAQGAPTTLDAVVTKLMTLADGDPRVRLTEDDIDVTSLAGDTVRGFALLSQQTVRNAITQLQQTFFFDVVESDGQLKFVKRGTSVVASLLEDELAAHEVGKSSSSNLVPLDFVRQSEVELPREVTVNYTDVENDYNQSTQRARREQTDAESNISETLPVVLSADEAAKVADVLLRTTWTERVAPIKLNLSAKWLHLEPADVISVTMRDGAVHVLRIVQVTLGVNYVLELTCATEYISLYTSSATGISVINPPTDQIVSVQTETFLIDVSAAFLTAFLPQGTVAGVLVGLGTTGDVNDFTGGTVTLSTGQVVSIDADSPVGFGTLTAPIGDTSTAQLAENQFDYTTSLSFRLLGGDVPTACSETQAQSLSRDCLVIVGDEIIAFTSVSYVSGVVTLTGLLRGLYGTATTAYYPTGTQVILAANLVFATIGSDAVGGIVTGSSGSSSDVVGYSGANVRPMSPVNVMAVPNGSDIDVTWTRRDYSPYALGLQATGGTIVNSEATESYETVIIDAMDAGGPTAKRSLTSTSPAVTYTEAQQTADWGAPLTAPVLARVYQLSQSVGRGFPRQTVLYPDAQPAPTGTLFTPIADGAYAESGVHWNGVQSVASGFWEVTTSVDATYGAAYLNKASVTQDVEVLALIKAPTGTLAREQCGVVLRALPAAVTGIFIGIGGTSNNELIARQMLGGAEGVSQTAAYSWTATTVYALRARHNGSRVQAKIWEYGDVEPSAWAIDFLDEGRGPFFGSTGVFAYHTASPTKVQYLAWAHGSRIAA